MNRIAWRLADFVTALLEPDERDAIRGDFAETGVTGGRALRESLGLVARRQVSLWKRKQPWLALLGAAVPMGVVFGGFSFQLNLWFGWLSREFMTLWSQGVRFENALPLADDLIKLACGCMIVSAWAWTAGFAAASLSRRTMWLPALLGLWAFSQGTVMRMPYLPVPAVLFSAIVQTALIVSPCLWGARRGMRSGVLGLKPAILGAAALAVWTLLLQVEYSREHLAFEVWKNGGALGAGLAWEPRPLPFAVILWQFGVLAIATSRRRPILKEPV